MAVILEEFYSFAVGQPRYLNIVLHQPVSYWVACSGLFQCNPSDPVYDLSPCKRFVAKGTEKHYGLQDFVDPINEYVNANTMMMTMKKPGSDWTKMKGLTIQAKAECAQALANKGDAVITGLSQPMHGHVAMVIAGHLVTFGSWGIKAPNSAAFSLGNENLSYVGEKLSKSFTASDSALASYYFKRSKRSF